MYKRQILPSSAARQPSAFPDITDEATAEAAEILRLLGIVSGTGSGNFEPGRTLTRAEFCKMAVEIMGNGDKVAAQMNRTVFADVPSTHWARGYVAVATQGSSSGSGKSAVSTPGIIRGDATGRFHPDRAITGAEAVTILMRILGYHDANVGVGAVWYDGYFSTARSIGLTDGLTLNPTGSITRGQAAILFENLLFTESKGSDDVYLTTLKGSITDEVPVSYTHLDVYKRQGIAAAVGDPDDGDRPAVLRRLDQLPVVQYAGGAVLAVDKDKVKSGQADDLRQNGAA